jgi:hypothetical protein
VARADRIAACAYQPGTETPSEAPYWPHKIKIVLRFTPTRRVLAYSSSQSSHRWLIETLELIDGSFGRQPPIASTDRPYCDVAALAAVTSE